MNLKEAETDRDTKKKKAAKRKKRLTGYIGTEAALNAARKDPRQIVIPTPEVR